MTAGVSTQTGQALYVRTDQAAHHVVQLQTNDAAHTVLDTLHVWVVWAEGHVKQPQPREEGYITTGGVIIGDGSEAITTIFRTVDPEAASNAQKHLWAFTFDIQPKAITDLTQDVPDLTGKSDPDYPPCDKTKTHIANGFPLWEGALYRWDTSQSMRIDIDNPNLIPPSLLPVIGQLYDGQPKDHLRRLDFPASDVEGNDDFFRATEDNDPYHAIPSGTIDPLAHGVGSITTFDDPFQPVAWFRNPADQQRFNGATFHLEADFATFVRLQIGHQWYRVSGHYNWFYSAKMKCQIGTQSGSTFGLWVNDFSKTNYTGVSDN